MFPILTFVLLMLFSAEWLVFAIMYWDVQPAKTGGTLFAITLAVVGFSFKTPDCTTWSCDAPPETMTAPTKQRVFTEVRQQVRHAVYQYRYWQVWDQVRQQVHHFVHDQIAGRLRWTKVI